MSPTKTIAFIGASTGVGLRALKHTLAAGHRCIALCRTPSKLTTIFPAAANSNLQIIQGNAHDTAAVSKCLTKQDGSSLVDIIVTTIGGKFIPTRLTIDDPHVCAKGMETLLGALSQLRDYGVTGKPLVIACSGLGQSKFGRDIPLSLYPLYHWMLKVPRADKKVMDESLIASGENFVIVRPSLLVDGETDRKIRVGIEDPVKGPQLEVIGWTISREDTGRWVAENLLLNMEAKYLGKNVTVTY